MRGALAVAFALPLIEGCVPAAIYHTAFENRKAMFETWANGIVGTEYEKAYLNAATGGTGKWGYGLLQSKEDREASVEYVYRQKHQCQIGVAVDKQSNLIVGWRYLSAPEKCWEYWPSA